MDIIRRVASGGSNSSNGLSDGGGWGLYADAFSMAANCLVKHPTIDGGKKRIVSTLANIATRVNAGAALADNDSTRRYCLTPKALNS